SGPARGGGAAERRGPGAAAGARSARPAGRPAAAERHAPGGAGRGPAGRGRADCRRAGAAGGSRQAGRERRPPMMTLTAVFWMYVLLFGIIGAFRGWAKELLVIFSILLAIAIDTVLLTYVEPVRII